MFRSAETRNPRGLPFFAKRKLEDEKALSGARAESFARLDRVLCGESFACAESRAMRQKGGGQGHSDETDLSEKEAGPPANRALGSTADAPTS